MTRDKMKPYDSIAIMVEMSSDDGSAVRHRSVTHRWNIYAKNWETAMKEIWETVRAEVERNGTD